MQMTDHHAPGLRLEYLRHRTETGTQASVGTDYLSAAVPHVRWRYLRRITYSIRVADCSHCAGFMAIVYVRASGNANRLA